MGLPQEPVSLTPDEVARLNRHLSDTRHSINNHLTLISTALELMRRKPESIPRMLDSLAEQPQRIRDEVVQFSDAFERALNIHRDSS
jgi:hypothetical protein